ncbi:hypothetical protein DFH07DRAFT_776461 [Mycena maculata]|uniref:Uncharacterized protein n=1 Tax=Mycena maculata TaxID=230809 RepID=A0AAD7ILW8_9AGAR|nr:hypothetical protein DFH07DRAFT_776461 [Mycena maculata]
MLFTGALKSWSDPDQGLNDWKGRGRASRQWWKRECSDKSRVEGRRKKYNGAMRVVESLGHDKNTITSGEQKLKGKKIHGSSVMAISASCTLFCTNFEHGHVEHGLLDKYKTLGWDGTLNSMAIMGTQNHEGLLKSCSELHFTLLEQSNYSPKNRGTTCVSTKHSPTHRALPA